MELLKKSEKTTYDISKIKIMESLEGYSELDRYIRKKYSNSIKLNDKEAVITVDISDGIAYPMFVGKLVSRKGFPSKKLEVEDFYIKIGKKEDKIQLSDQRLVQKILKIYLDFLAKESIEYLKENGKKN